MPATELDKYQFTRKFDDIERCINNMNNFSLIEITFALRYLLFENPPLLDVLNAEKRFPITFRVYHDNVYNVTEEEMLSSVMFWKEINPQSFDGYRELKKTAFLDYVCTEAKGIDLSAKRCEKIKKAMQYLKDDLLEKMVGYLNKEVYNTQQLDYLVSQERKELNNWFANMHLFYVESLFAQTGDESEHGVLNRHSIFHALSLNIYHTEENYIKLFNSLIFIGWIFLQVEGQSLLFPNSKEDNTRIYLNRRQHYETLIQKSEALVVHKHSLLKKYPLHNGRDFVRRSEFKKIVDGASPHVKAIIKMMFYVECKTEKWILNLVAKEVAKKSKKTLTTKKK